MWAKAAAARSAAWTFAEGGWHVALLSLTVYLMTLAPGITLWDSGEFILCGAQVDIGHPPGAPFYWLMLRLASMLAPSGYEGLACNAMSALCMSFAAMTVSLVFRELALWVSKETGRITLLAGQTSAGLTFAFADSVWSLGIETEVYGAAALAAGLILWLTLRWRRTGEWRLLALAAYATGLAVGVHWLAWLVLPSAMSIVGSRHGRKGMLLGLAAGLASAFVLQWQASGHVFDLGVMMDIMAVNSFRMPVGTGLAISMALVLAALFTLLFVTRSQRLRTLVELALLSQLGLLTYAVPFLRSQSEVAISVGSPSDAPGLTDYMGRKQYGEAHLIYGPTYASQPDGVRTDIVMSYDKEAHQYIPREVATAYTYPDSSKVLLPRMVNPDEESLTGYASWGAVSALEGKQPTLGENILFVWQYQLGFMFGRYWLWNYLGRDSDTTLPLNPFKRGAETLWGLPMLLALIGVVSLLRKGSRRAGVAVLTLWAMGGCILALYLNMQPYEPRERDYIFLLSYMATSLAIAFGTTAAMKAAQRQWQPSKTLSTALGAALMLVPALMLWQNYRTHDRSGDTLVEQTAKGLLGACPRDAMLFVYGDNETYSLWHAQQELGVRRDVRIVNYGLLGQPWYVDQLCRPGRSDSPLVFPNSKEVKEGGVMLFLAGNGEKAKPLNEKIEIAHNETGNYFTLASDSIRIATWQDSISIHIGKEELGTEELSLLALLDANSHRPACFVAGALPDWLEVDRYTYDIGPIAYLASDTASMAGTRTARYKAFRLPDATQYNMTEDEEGYLEMLNIRRMSNDVAEEALIFGDIATCREALRRSLAWMPKETNTADTELVRLGGLLAEAGERRMARTVLQEVASHCAKQMTRAAQKSQEDMEAAQQILDNNAELTEALLMTLDRSGNHDMTSALIELAQSLKIEL